MKSLNSMVLITFKNWWDFLEARYMSFMSYISGIDITSDNFVLKFEEFPLGGWNHTPYLVNPLANMSLESKYWHLSVMKP
jgi:hypothetical protein